MIVEQGAGAWQLRLGDSDNYMRLVQVRDLLGGQGWFDLVQHRINPPEGLHSHWSRLADLPYVVPIRFLGLFLPATLAERLVLVAVPLLLFLLTLLVVARCADRMAGWRGAACACLLLGLALPVLAQFVPGRIDHHGLQILLLVTAASAALGPDTGSQGAKAGAASALSLAIGLEIAPYLAAMAAWLALRWMVRGAEARAKTTGFFLALVLLVPLLFAVTVAPGEWLAPHYDELGIAHVVVIIVGGLSWTLLMRAPDAGRFNRRIGAAAAAAAMTLASVSLYPGLLVPPYEAIDPLLRQLWIDNLAETQSFAEAWRRAPALAMGHIWFVAAAAALALWRALRSAGVQRDDRLLLALLGLVGLALTLSEVRSDAPATAIAVIIAAPLLAELWTRWQQGRQNVIVLAAAAALLNPVAVFALMAIGQGAAAGRDPVSVAGTPPFRCDRPGDFALLQRLPRGLVASPIDQSAPILARTGHSVISAPNHRNAEANGAVYALFATPPPASEAIARHLRADYVVFCRGAPEVANLAAFAPNGLLAALRSGAVPPWLVSAGETNGLVVLRMRRSPAR